MSWPRKDSVKIDIDDRFPLSKLKVIHSIDASSAEVEKILNHKLEMGVTKFLVKWRGSKNSENSWVNENDFNTKEIIQKYFNKTNNKRPQEPKRTSSRIAGSRIPINLVYNVLIIILLSLPLISCSFEEFDFRKGYFNNDIWTFTNVSLPLCSTTRTTSGQST